MLDRRERAKRSALLLDAAADGDEGGVRCKVFAARFEVWGSTNERAAATFCGLIEWLRSRGGRSRSARSDERCWLW